VSPNGSTTASQPRATTIQKEQGCTLIVEGHKETNTGINPYVTVCNVVTQTQRDAAILVLAIVIAHITKAKSNAYPKHLWYPYVLYSQKSGDFANHCGYNMLQFFLYFCVSETLKSRRNG
jgi:hypothetical protein